MDPDRTPTEPTTDFEPPAATSVVTGPSLASTSPAAGRRRGSMAPAGGDRARPGGDVQRRDRGRTPGDARLGHCRDDDPEPPPAAGAGLRPHPRGVGHPPQASTSAPTELNDKELIYGAINGMTEAVGDTGHTSFLTPAERAATAERPVRLVRRDRRPDRRRRGRPAADRRRLQGQPGREGRPASSVTRSSRSTASDDQGPRRSTRSSAGSAARPGSKVKVTVRHGADGKDRETLSMMRADVAGRVRHLDHGPGHEDGADPPRPVLERRRRRTVKKPLKAIEAAGADRLVLDLRGNPGGYVNEADGGRQPVPDKAATSSSSATPTATRRHHPVSAGRRGDRPPAGRPRRRRHGQLRRDRLGRAPGREAGRDHRHRRRTAPARSSASSRCPTGRRCASGPSSG